MLQNLHLRFIMYINSLCGEVGMTQDESDCTTPELNDLLRVFSPKQLQNFHDRATAVYPLTVAIEGAIVEDPANPTVGPAVYAGVLCIPANQGSAFADSVMEAHKAAPCSRYIPTTINTIRKAAQHAQQTDASLWLAYAGV